jgi:hypothetical protein
MLGAASAGDHAAYASIYPHTSAYVSTRQHTSAYASIRQHTPAYASIRQHASALALADRFTHTHTHTHTYALALRRFCRRHCSRGGSSRRRPSQHTCRNHIHIYTYILQLLCIEIFFSITDVRGNRRACHIICVCLCVFVCVCVVCV